MISTPIQSLRKLPGILLIIFGVLLLLNVAGILVTYITGHTSLLGVLHRINFDRENSLPTYFSVVNLLICAGLLFSIYRIERVKRPFNEKYWLILSIFFLWLSVDESASVHEMAMAPIRGAFDIISVSVDWLAHPWVIPGVIIVLAAAGYFFRFYMGLSGRYKLLFLVAAVLFIGGSMGMETFNGFFEPETPRFDLLYSLLMTVEESMEMAAVIIFIYALIEYLRALMPQTVTTGSPATGAISRGDTA